MNTNYSSRLLTLINYLHISPYSFYKLCGLNFDTLDRIIEGKENFQDRVIVKITNKFPEVNELWLKNESDIMLKVNYFDYRINKIKFKPRSIPHLIKVLQKTFNMKSNELAVFVGVNKSTITRMKNGDFNSVRPETVDKFLKAFPAMSNDWFDF
ncbi:helix-turn-helix domain-containing protein [Chryseobacterium sp. DT-3]|uniref:helix-turn-helix domain-containing protein n=1 Tax=Chryseobacterium sp. DT-3 TaxID=3396164 RepID=UPI003F1E03FC